MPKSVELTLDGTFYHHFGRLLESHGLACVPAEVHGILAGLACAGEDDATVSTWQTLILADTSENVATTRLEEAFSGLMALVQRALHSNGFEFQLLLPPDNDPISVRAQALADWCHGFTLGLHWNHAIDPSVLETDAAEAVTDIADIARAQVGDESKSEQERALAELEEYLRVATQLVFESASSTIQRVNPNA
jgi:yecA family protein